MPPPLIVTESMFRMCVDDAHAFVFKQSEACRAKRIGQGPKYQLSAPLLMRASEAVSLTAYLLFLERSSLVYKVSPGN